MNVGRRTRVELMSYEDLYTKLEHFERMQRKIKKLFVSKDKQNKESKNLVNNCQMYMIDNETFDSLLTLLQPSHSKSRVKNFLFDLLLSFEMVFPKGKINYNQNSSFKQTFIVPLLFPPSRPKQILNLELFNNNLQKNFEWILVYHLPFKPSSIWKRLFLRIRNVVVEKSENGNIDCEFYWIDGCFFQIDGLVVDLEITKVKNLSFEDQNNTNMNLKIISKENPLYFYQNMKMEIEDYLYKWFYFFYFSILFNLFIFL